jgi:hypothetical protein
MTKLAWIGVAALALPAAADEVTLKNGSKLEGVVREEADRVTVEVPGGSVTVGRDQVKSIDRPSERLSSEYDRRLQGLNGEGGSGVYDLALWARQQGMEARAQAMFRRTLEIDPDHEGARKALGYRAYKGVWLTEEQYMTAALGLVEYQGKWLPAETVVVLRRADHEFQLAQLKETVEAQKIQRQAEIDRQRASTERGSLDYMREEKLLNRVPGAQLPWGLRYWGPAVPRAE